MRNTPLKAFVKDDTIKKLEKSLKTPKEKKIFVGGGYDPEGMGLGGGVRYKTKKGNIFYVEQGTRGGQAGMSLKFGGKKKKRK